MAMNLLLSSRPRSIKETRMPPPIEVNEDTLFLSVRELGQLIKAQRLSPLALTERYLQRLAKIGPKLGAILLGKLAMVELAGGCGYNNADASFTGPGRTPWNLDYWSGGSSSGPGAATAAGLVGFAIGSETSGSIITPAAFCGVSGLRPTYGRVSRHGAMALCWTLDKLGPMCRTADDCGLVLAAIAGADPLDPSSVGRPFPHRPKA